jgi:DNA-3-methyladenine glycosylase
MRQTTPAPGLILPRAFYVRDTVTVARALLGAVIEHGRTSGRIVEVEAYLSGPGPGGGRDLAAHSSSGLTPRTQVIFGPPGHAYVYLIYGIHLCLNVVAEPEGVPGCVLIRALEPLEGIPLMQHRRKAKRITDLTSGPGKLTAALGITRKHYGADLTRGPLRIRAGPAASFEIAAASRIGIRHCADWPLRFYIRGNKFVSAV